MRILSIVILTTFCFFGCKDVERTISPKVLSLDLFNIKNQDGEHTISSLKFAEKFTYLENGQIDEHFILDDNGIHKNNEKYTYVGEEKAVSQYYDAYGKPMSFYEHVFDKNKNKTSTKSYDANTKELLRIEEFIYNDKNWLKTKFIKTAEGQLSRVYQFEYDAFGNETRLQILDAAGEQILLEEYRITAYNDKQHWLEKWGFQNDEPISFRKRTLSY